MFSFFLFNPLVFLAEGLVEIIQILLVKKVHRNKKNVLIKYLLLVNAEMYSYALFYAEMKFIPDCIVLNSFS